MIQNIASYPVNVGLFGTNAVMLEADFLTHLIKQLGFDIHDSSQPYFVYLWILQKTCCFLEAARIELTLVLTLMLGVLVLFLSHNGLKLINRLIEARRITGVKFDVR
jgi:hypothetical protein